MYLITNLENHPCFGLDDPPSPKFSQCHRFRPTQRWFHQRCGFRPPVRFSIMGMLRWKFECPNFETKKTHVRHKKSGNPKSRPLKFVRRLENMFITPVWYHWRPLDTMHNETGDAQPVRPATWTPKRVKVFLERWLEGKKKSMTGIQQSNMFNLSKKNTTIIVLVGHQVTRGPGVHCHIPTRWAPQPSYTWSYNPYK